MCEDSGMRATGIPTHIGLMLKIKNLTNEIEQLRSSVNTGYGRLVDELPLLISDQVERRIRASFHVEGVIPLTTADLERSISTLRGDVQSMLQRQQQSIMQNITQNEINANTNNDIGNAHINWGIWNWNDGLIGHYVPPGWNFPHGITLKALWNLWFFGNEAEQI